MSRADPGPPVRGTGSRQEWIDVARGLAVLLVVAAHVVDFVSMRGERAALLEPALHVVQGMRVPSLFFLAGVLFASYLDRPWRTVVRQRVLLFGWLLVLWLAVERLVDVALGRALWPGPLELLAYVGRWFATPDHNLWFIAGVLWMFVIARALAGRRLVMLLIFVVMVSGVLPVLPFGPLERFYVLQAPFVLLGVVFAPWVLRTAPRTGLVVAALLVVAWVPLGVLRTTGVTGPLPPDAAGSLVALAGMPALVGAGRLLAAAPGRRAWAFVGRRTLAVYLVHYPLALVVFRQLDVHAPEWVPANPYLSALVVGLAVVGAGLAASLVVTGLGISGVFTAPRALLWVFDRAWPEKTGRRAVTTSERGPTVT